MRFLYTGSKQYLSEQFNPEKSLGGFCSNSVIPNRKNNIFSDVSYFSRINEVEECKAVIIENNSENTLTDVSLGYVYDKELYDIQIAIVSLNSENSMELISNSKNLPYYANFFDASIEENLDNSYVFSEIVPNGKYGIWIKRKIKDFIINE